MVIRCPAKKCGVGHAPGGAPHHGQSALTPCSPLHRAASAAGTYKYVFESHAGEVGWLAKEKKGNAHARADDPAELPRGAAPKSQGNWPPAWVAYIGGALKAAGITNLRFVDAMTNHIDD